MNIEILGFAGAALMVLPLGMKTMIPLRVVGIASSIVQIVFALLAGITPMLIQHSILLPMNTYRLYEHIRLVRRVRKAVDEDLSMDWLIPFMTKRKVGAGEFLFHKGQFADEMFIVASGRLRLSEIAAEVMPGDVVGELGLLAPNHLRTQTLECIEDSVVMQVSYDNIKSLYFQNPSFGFYLLRLISARLFQNIAGLEMKLEQRGQYIEGLQAAVRPSQIGGQKRAARLQLRKNHKAQLSG